MTYKIIFHTGVGDFEFEGTLSEAMEAADEAIVYTKRHVTIEEDGDEIAIRHWWGITTGIENEETPIQFGEYGFYSDWEEV